MSVEGANNTPTACTATDLSSVRYLTRGSLLARNTVWNLLGQTIPMGVGLIAIPRLIHSIGTDRFGVLTIAWMVVGYFSFFDLGLGRAMTNLVAQKLATGNDEELPQIIWTANLLMVIFGILGGLLLIGLSPLIVTGVLRTPLALIDETRKSLVLLGFSLPFVISTAGFRGVLEARQRFDLINVVRLPMGTATFAAPLLVLPWSHQLPGVVGILVFARIVFWAVYAFLALKGMSLLPRRRDIDRRLLPMLFSFGAWMTVSNVISPLMAYLDRFLVAALLSLTAVAYYATPFEAVTKLLILPTAMVGVLFPAFSSALVADPQRAGKLFDRAVKIVVLTLLPLTLIVIIFAQDGLNIWLGRAFAIHSSRVLQWLAIGVLANGLATLPFAFVQGAGRADITGKLHLIELPFYLVAVLLLTKYFGIEGTAIAWTLRVIVDCALLFGAVERLLHRLPAVKAVSICIGTAGVSFAVSMINMTLPLKLAVIVAELSFTIMLARYLLFPDSTGDFESAT